MTKTCSNVGKRRRHSIGRRFIYMLFVLTWACVVVAVFVLLVYKKAVPSATQEALVLEPGYGETSYCVSSATHLFHVMTSRDKRVYLAAFDFARNGARGLLLADPLSEGDMRADAEDGNMSVSLVRVQSNPNESDLVVYDMSISLKDCSMADDLSSRKIRIRNGIDGKVVSELILIDCERDKCNRQGEGLFFAEL